jgi:plasmid stabilization system protein ParE
MALRVRLSPRAARDLKEIRAYLIQRSPKGADRVRADINQTLRTLARHPGVGRPADIAGIRLIVTARFSYRVYHAIEGNELVIVHVRHGARDAPRNDDL